MKKLTLEFLVANPLLLHALRTAHKIYQGNPRGSFIIFDWELMIDPPREFFTAKSKKNQFLLESVEPDELQALLSDAGYITKMNALMAFDDFVQNKANKKKNFSYKLQNNVYTVFQHGIKVFTCRDSAVDFDTVDKLKATLNIVKKVILTDDKKLPNGINLDVSSSAIKIESITGNSYYFNFAKEEKEDVKNFIDKHIEEYTYRKGDIQQIFEFADKNSLKVEDLAFFDLKYTVTFVDSFNQYNTDILYERLFTNLKSDLHNSLSRIESSRNTSAA